MAIKAILDDLDDAPETIRDQYEEKDGKFILSVDGVDSHPTVATLKNAYERVKADKKRLGDEIDMLKARLEGLPDDFDAQAYEALKAAAEGKEPPKADEQVAQVRGQLERKHAADLAKKDERIATLEAEVRRRAIDDGLMGALVEANIDKPYLPAAKALLKDKGVIKLIEEDGKFDATVETDMGPMPLSKFVSDWAAGDEGKVFVSQARGADAKGGGGGRPGEVNPWKKETFNMTEQGNIFRQDRGKAERLMRAAGLSDNEIRSRLAA